MKMVMMVSAEQEGDPIEGELQEPFQEEQQDDELIAASVPRLTQPPEQSDSESRAMYEWPNCTSKTASR